MKTSLAPEALEMETVLKRALERAGGRDLVVRAQAGEDVFGDIGRLIDSLGLWDLRPRSAELDCEVAAVACRVAGRFALPYPVAERFSGDPDTGIEALAVVAPHAPRINLAYPELAWFASDGVGNHGRVSGIGEPLGSKLGALVSDVEVSEWVAGDDLSPLALTLPTWVLLGMIESAFAMTRQHLLDRYQFGKPLASFQALQFRMADSAAQLQGFSELAKHTLWSVMTAQDGRLGDAIACRLVALETAESVFRTCHQMYGAMGFCDETAVSWLSRYSQPIRRLPWGQSETESRLLKTIEAVPFSGLFTSTGDVAAIIVQ